MAFSQTGSALAKPLTSFLVLASRSPFMNDMVFAASAPASLNPLNLCLESVIR